MPTTATQPSSRRMTRTGLPLNVAVGAPVSVPPMSIMAMPPGRSDCCAAKTYVQVSSNKPASNVVHSFIVDDFLDRCDKFALRQSRPNIVARGDCGRAQQYISRICPHDDRVAAVERCERANRIERTAK